MTRFENEPEFLTQRRDAAAALALSLPLPDRAMHRWRYTDPAALVPGGAFSQAMIDARGPSPAVTIELPEAAVKAGVRACAFPEALAIEAAVVGEFLGRIARAEDPFVAVSLATFSGGAVVVIPDGAMVDTPIVVRTRVDGAATDSPPAASRTLIVAGAGSRATVLEDTTVTSGTHYGVTEARVGDGAQLTHVRIEAVSRGAVGFTRAAWDLGRDATLTHFDVLLPDGLLKAEAAPLLGGRGARSEGLVAVLARGRGRADFRVREDHATTDTVSRVTYRAVARDKAQAVFTGLLRIEEHAARTEAYEEARAMLLSKTASADIIPELEILNHDVRCSHGAAVGPVDEDAKFYLRARGLSEAEAEAMLVEGFVEPVLARLPDEQVAEWIRQKVREVASVA